jgi:hypothetical protein
LEKTLRGFTTIAGYLTLLALGLFLYFSTRKPGGKIAPMTALVERVMHHRTTRIAIVLAWWWVGWHFMVNTVRR